MRKIILVAGARPNFMKIAPIMHELSKYPDEFNAKIVHTGQHYDKNMSDIFFRDLDIPEPDIYFGVGSGSHAYQTSEIMLRFEEYCIKEKPDMVIVVGDVNSTLACSVVAKKLQICLAHVEAGLRSFDRTMPEEINRIVTDSISDIFFITERSGEENLKREGHADESIFFVGNVMIDTLLKGLKKAKSLPSLLKAEQYALVTLHRPSNVDNKDNLKRLVEILKAVSSQLPVIFPAHPRTQGKIKEFGFDAEFNFSVDLSKPMGIQIISPLGYLDFVKTLSEAKVCLTDSGGIQEETTVLGVPCITLRDTTERPITCTNGTNTLTGIEKEKIMACIKQIMENTYKKGITPEKWDGRAAERIIAVLKNKLLF